MSFENWHVVKKITARDLLPEILFWSFIETIVAVLIIWLVLFLKTGSLLPEMYSETRTMNLEESVSVLIGMLLLLLFFVCVFIFHEVVHVLTAKSFGVSSKFGWGRIGPIFYLSVEPRVAVNRRQYLWIAMAPTFLVNFLLIILIWITNDPFLQGYFAMIYVIHFMGCGGDLALITNALRYPPTVAFKDEGIDLVILSPEPIEEKELFLTRFKPVTKPLSVLSDFIVFFFVGIIITLFVSTILLIILMLFGVTNWNILVSIQTWETGFSMSIRNDHILASSLLTAFIAWIVNKKFRKLTLSRKPQSSQ